MYKFDWNTILTEDIIDSILGIIGNTNDSIKPQIRELLVLILMNEGGFPVSETDLDATSGHSVVHGIIDDCIRRSFPTEFAQKDWPGYIRTKSLNGKFDILTAHSRIPIHTATAKELNGIPGIGDSITSKIIEDRRRFGLFRDGKDLARRINGIGESMASDLDAILQYQMNVKPEPPQNGLLNTLRHLLSLNDEDKASQLVKILELSAVTSAKKSPDRWFGFRMHEQEKLTTEFIATTMEILQGTAYYTKMAELLSNAQKSIYVCMFHVAFPNDNHPTKKLLDTLIQAHKKNVQVRVLLDRDRPKDPYGSTIINKQAIKYLINGGVVVRVDSPEKLLHSKVITIDTKQIIIGSHNWSAGSYYEYDDLSVLLECENAAHVMTTRFETLWDKASNVNID